VILLFKSLVPFLVIFLFYFASRITFFFIPVYLDLRGFTGLEIGLLVALSSVAAFISFFPSGLVNDRKSIKKPLALGFLLTAVFYYGITVFSGFAFFFLLFLIGGIGLKIGINCLRNYFFKKSMIEKRGESLGAYQLFVMAGVFAGVLSFSILVPLLSFEIMLQAMGLLLVALIVLLFFVRDFETSETKIRDYKNDFLKKNVVFFSVLLFLFTLHWGAESTTYGLLLIEDFGLNITQTGMYMAFSLIFLGITAYVFGKKLDRKETSVSKMLAAGMVLSGVMHILMAFEPLWFSFAARIIHEVGDGLFEIGMLFWVADSFSFKRLAGNASLLMTVTVLGESVGAVMFSAIGGAFGYGSAFISSGVISVIAAVIFLVFRKRFFLNHNHAAGAAA
jgi:MFS family permease